MLSLSKGRKNWRIPKAVQQRSNSQKWKVGLPKSTSANRIPMKTLLSDRKGELKL